MFVLIIGATVVLAAGGLRQGSQFFYIIASVAVGVAYIRRSPWDFLLFSLWAWTLTPFVRRLIDLYCGFDPTNIVLGLPNLLSLLMVADILSSARVFRLKESTTGLLLLTPVVYGIVVSLVQGNIISGLIGAADWIVPITYYYFLIRHASEIADLERPLTEFVTLNMLLLAVYGVVQFFAPPPWDSAWLINSGVTAGGQPVAYKIRVFSTLNSAGVAAPWFEMLIILSLHFRTRLASVLTAVCVVVLLMTLGRAVLGALLVALLIVFLSSGGRMLRTLAITIVAVVLLLGTLSAYYPSVGQRFTSRFDTVNDLGQDDSAIHRLALYRAAPEWLDKHPLGLGIGALGRGAVSSDDANLISIDSGPLAIYLSLGWIAGSIYIAGIVAVLIQAASAARRCGSPAAVVAATAAFAASLGLIFGNVTGLIGVIIWMCAGYASVLGMTKSPTEFRLGAADGRPATEMGASRPN
ncbi:O-antigen ligase family protein [Lichenicoccus sp.]|uniref:O-antigen ligase family protein n=1 Tax=Lichenicoccus sp. TaxID=2781899 RepID=UPI003D14C1EA